MHYKRWAAHGDPEARFPNTESMEHIFWPKVTITPSCWFWGGSLNNSGYGGTKYLGKTIGAHRRAYIWAYGELPDGMQVDHKYNTWGCVRHCVNPEHLRLATAKQNLENTPMHPSNTSGYKGVSFHRKNKTWHPRVSHARVDHSMGYWPYYELHVAGYKAMMKRLELFTHNERDRYRV